MESIIGFLVFVLALVCVISFHEFAHAWVADRLGDPTPKYYGRLTLNPLAHLDLVGTLMLFLIHIGWGKPVPINPDNFAKPKRDSALVALAGPGSNILLAFAVALPFKFFSTAEFPVGISGFASFMSVFLGILFDLSIILGVFNLLPFPPLDGSKFFGLLVPRRYYHLYEAFLRNGTTYFIVFMLLDIFILERIFGFSVVGFVVGRVAEIAKMAILFGT